MPQNNLMGFALDMIQHNPALQNNPNAREMIDVIKSGDANRGRLACLYTVRDHMKAKQHDESKSSEFLTAAVGVPTPELMAVIDQHMEAIKVVYPSEYNAIVAKIRSLHEAT